MRYSFFGGKEYGDIHKENAAKDGMLAKGYEAKLNERNCFIVRHDLQHIAA